MGLKVLLIVIDGPKSVISRFHPRGSSLRVGLCMID